MSIDPSLLDDLEWRGLIAHSTDLDALRAALGEGIVLAPGDVFSPSHAASDFMRFNVAQMGDPRVYEVLGRALRA